MFKGIFTIVVLVFLSLSFTNRQVYAQPEGHTDVNQDWFDDENENDGDWDNLNGYHIIQDLIWDRAITIGPAVILYIDEGRTINVRDGGSITADDVTFQCTNVNVDWEGIIFNAANGENWDAAGNSQFDECIFTNFDLPALDVEGGLCDIDDCEFTSGAADGSCISWEINNAVQETLTRNTFTTFSFQPAVIVTDGDLRFDDCEFDGGGGGLADAELLQIDDGEVWVSDCIFSGSETCILQTGGDLEVSESNFIGDEPIACIAINQTGGDLEVWGCDFFGDDPVDCSAMIIEGTADVYCNTIWDYTSAIIVSSTLFPEIHNNFIYDSVTGIETTDDSNPRIYNNAIFEITGNAISVEQNGEPDIIYNTIVNIGASCIFLDQQE